MARTSFYVDGFNLYHVIDHFRPNCKWLDLYKMVKSIIPSTETIGAVYYFSAYSFWKKGRAEKHMKYVSALKSSGVKVILGRFKEKNLKCPLCKKEYIAHEEKQTDVNIALKILEGAVADNFDTAIIVSGDTDLVPAITTVKRLYPEKRIGVLAPIGATADYMKNVADFWIKMKRKHLELNQFPPMIGTTQGQIQIPNEWKVG